MLEVGVIFEEVSMTEDVSSYKGILQQIVHFHQEGVARIGIDHHLIDLAQSEVILHLLPVKSLPEGPVAEATRQTIRGELVHDGRRDQLEVGWEGIKTELTRLFPGRINAIAQAFEFAIRLVICHSTAPVLPDRTTTGQEWHRVAQRTCGAQDTPLSCPKW